MRIGASMRQTCCYYNCENPATIYIGENGNRTTEWICLLHYDRWYTDRARFLSDGRGCQMEEI